MDEVARICDDVVFLYCGEIVARGTPQELTQRIPHTNLQLAFEASTPMWLATWTPASTFSSLGVPGESQVIVTIHAARHPAGHYDIPATWAPTS